MKEFSCDDFFCNAFGQDGTQDEKLRIIDALSKTKVNNCLGYQDLLVANKYDGSEKIRTLLADNNVEIDEVKHFLFSQFSDSDNLLTLEKLGVSKDRYIFVGDHYGYTGTSSPIMALHELWRSMEKIGDIVFCLVAAGYSMNAVLYKL